MAKKTTKKSQLASEDQPQRFLNSINRKVLYGSLGVLILVVAGLFLMVPHYKPLKYASAQEIADARKMVIAEYFIQSTYCYKDDLSQNDRVATFNKYFKMNFYANRAIIRGCGNGDRLLYKNDQGLWKELFAINADARQNPVWQKMCLITDITTADTVIRPENRSIDEYNLKDCTALRKQSYIEVSVHFHN